MRTAMTVPGGACGAACMTGAAGIPGSDRERRRVPPPTGGFAAAVCWMLASACVTSGGGSSARRADGPAARGTDPDARKSARQDQPDDPELLGPRQDRIAGEIPDEGPHVDQRRR